jgi:hypothetical protein
MIECAPQFDPDHPRRNAESVCNILLREFLQPGGDQNLTCTLRQAPDGAVERFELEPGFGLARGTWRRIRYFKCGLRFCTARTAALPSTMIDRELTAIRSK